MERRTLLGALLASPLGILIPRQTKAAWLPGSEYRHFIEMMEDIITYVQGQSHVMVTSITPKEQLYGFAASYVDEEGVGHFRLWKFSATEIKRLIDNVPDNLKRLLLERTFMSQDGRDVLARAIEVEALKWHLSEDLGSQSLTVG